MNHEDPKTRRHEGLLLAVAFCLSATVSAQAPQGLINEEEEPRSGFGNTFAGNERYIVAGVGSGDAQAEDAGYALIYERQSDGWELVDGLVDTDGREGDRFGWRVAMTGSTALVVALQRHDDEMTRLLSHQPALASSPLPARSGAIFVFEPGDDGWVQRQIIQPDHRWNRGEFGYSLAVSGRTILVGSPKSSAQNRHAGSAYVFARDEGGTWSQVQEIVPGDGAPTEYGGPSPVAFGWAVDLDGDHAVIGTPYGGGLTGEFYNRHGTVFVFERDSSTGKFAEVQRLGHEDPALDEKFGNTVAIAGDWILVGSAGGVRKVNPGHVRAFRRGADGVWVLKQVLEASDAQQHDQFGANIEVFGNRALITAVMEDGGPGDPASASGSVYLFELVDGGDRWEQKRIFRSPDRRRQDFFGMGLFLGPGYALMGSAGLDGIKGARARNIGAIYVYDLVP